MTPPAAIGGAIAAMGIALIVGILAFNRNPPQGDGGINVMGIAAGALFTLIGMLWVIA